MCKESSLNCCQLCAEKICYLKNVSLTNNEINMLSLLGDGMGIGGMCGALTGSLAAMGILLYGNKNKERLRTELILSFAERFSSINCCKLTKYHSDFCSEIIDFCINSTMNILKNEN